MLREPIISDYFYGDEAEQFSYFRIPRLLLTSPRFKVLSTDAKLLYGILFDRMSLSARNGWHDEDGRVYIFYTLDEIQEDLNCCHEKAFRLLSDLDTEKGCGLIERVKQGQGRPAKIYDKRFTTRQITAESPAPQKIPRLPKSRSQDFRFLEVQTSENQTVIILNLISAILIHLSITFHSPCPRSGMDGSKRISERDQRKH